MIIRIGWFELLVIITVLFALLKWTHHKGFMTGADFVLREWKREVADTKLKEE